MHKSRFNKKVRISEKNLNWLKENKDTRTMAGFLDKLINEYKNEKEIESTNIRNKALSILREEIFSKEEAPRKLETKETVLL